MVSVCLLLLFDCGETPVCSDSQLLDLYVIETPCFLRGFPHHYHLHHLITQKGGTDDLNFPEKNFLNYLCLREDEFATCC